METSRRRQPDEGHEEMVNIMDEKTIQERARAIVRAKLDREPPTGGGTVEEWEHRIMAHLFDANGNMRLDGLRPDYRAELAALYGETQNAAKESIRAVGRALIPQHVVIAARRASELGGDVYEFVVPTKVDSQ